MKKFKFLSVILAFMVFLGSFAACNPTTSSDPTPTHTCESACETCGKCTDADCSETACADKCQGHHTCENVCETCNKCTNAECTEAACADKCGGHHTCESVCTICQKCADLECTEAVCADKCQGHHEQKACATCGKCTDLECTEEGCEDRCFGHVVADPNFDTYELNLMSFNIAASEQDESTNDLITSWVNRREAVVDFINNSGANAIALQEVEEREVESLNQRLYLEQNLAKKYEMIYFHKYVSLAIVYDKTVFNLVKQEHYWLSATPDVESPCWEDASQYRMAAILVLEHRATGETVRVVNTHGPAPSGTISKQLNIKCFELITERSFSGDNDPFTVLLGDFNTVPGEYGYAPVADKLQDCRVAAETSNTREYNTDNGYGERFDVSTAAGQVARQTDFCFVPNTGAVKVLSYEVRNDRFGDNNNNYLSDHFAIQTTVRIYNDADKSWTDFH